MAARFGIMVVFSVGGVLVAGVGYRATFMASAGLVAQGVAKVWAAFRTRERTPRGGG